VRWHPIQYKSKQSPDLCTDRPVILEEDELNTRGSEPKVAAVFEPVDAGADSSFDLNKSIDPSNHEIWWDFEDECYTYNDLCPSPALRRYDGLPSTPILAQGQPYSYRHISPPLCHLTNQHDSHKPMRGVSDETLAQSLLLRLDEDSGRSEKERSSGSHNPYRLSAKQLHLQVGQKHSIGEAGHSRLKVFRQGSPLCIQNQMEEQQEVAIDMIGQDVQIKHEDSDNCVEEREEQRGERRRYQDTINQTGNDIHHFENNNGDRNTNGEDDKDPRPVKLRRPDSLPLPSTIPLEIDDTQSQ